MTELNTAEAAAATAAGAELVEALTAHPALAPPKPADVRADAAALGSSLLNPPVVLDDRRRALELITALAARGDSPRYIAEALRRAGIKTSRGKATWSYTSVEYLAKANGVQLRGYKRAG